MDVGMIHACEIFYILNRVLSSIVCKDDKHSGLKTWLSKLLMTQALRLEFSHQNPMDTHTTTITTITTSTTKALDMVVCACGPSTGKVEKGKFLGS